MIKSTSVLHGILLPMLIIGVLSSCSERLPDGGLKIGWAIGDVTPEGPASLRGQYYERISEYVQSPLKVTAMAIESTSGGGNDQAICISMDFVAVNDQLQQALRDKVAGQIPGFDVNRLFLNATHTHSAPYPELEDEYGQMVLEKLTTAAVSSWNSRKPAGISRSMKYAVTGHNRRVQYTDGTTQMYGATDVMEYMGIEGPTDPAVDMLFCWDLNKELTGIVMNVTCPAQVTEAKYYVSADYWGELRRAIKDKFPGEVVVFPQCGAAGDLAPRDLTCRYRAGEPNMWDVPGAAEIARRLAGVIDESYTEARNSIQTDPVFMHAVRWLDLPTLRVSEEEYLKASEIVAEIRSREPSDPESPESAWNRFLKEIEENEKANDYGPWDNKLSDFGQLKPREAIMAKYASQDQDSVCRVEVHVMRLGDAVIATNPFELYVDYGLSITGKSMAKQTFLVQLCCGSYGYLATPRALQGGGYSAMYNNRVGPEGGKMLVDETVAMINDMWNGKPAK